MSKIERPSQPIDLSRDLAGLFPLGEMVDQLRREDVYENSNRNAVTLIHDPSLRAVLTVAKEGTECGDHNSQEPTMIVNLLGRLAILEADDGGVIEINEGSAAALAPNIRHRLSAVTECAYLTIVPARTS